MWVLLSLSVDVSPPAAWSMLSRKINTLLLRLSLLLYKNIEQQVVALQQSFDRALHQGSFGIIEIKLKGEIMITPINFIVGKEILLLCIVGGSHWGGGYCR